MSETPSIDVIRHWVAWGPAENCPDELIDHDPERVELFESWLAGVIASERQRAIEIINKSTFHYGKTHSARTECRICEIMLAIEGKQE